MPTAVRVSRRAPTGPTWLCVVLTVATAGAAGAQPPATVESCADAVRAMLGVEAEVRTGSDPGPPSAAGGTIAWQTPEGHRGTCSTDGAGRLFSVRIESFPSGEAPSEWTAYPVTCESKDGGRKECAIRAPSSVELERRLGAQECVAGSTWGASGTTLWVDRGCRARFRVTPVAAWAPYTVTCESQEGRHRNCEIRAGGRVRLLNQVSRAECVQGRTWDYRGTALWVDRGCRGVFEVTAGGSWGSDYERGRDSCLEQALRDGMTLLREVGSSQAGRFYEFEMDLRRRGSPYEALCRYDPVTGEAEWSSR